jgi:predicted transcriptional regulator
MEREAMLRDEQLSILRDISQSVAFADDRHGKIGELIADGYVMKDGDLFELTAKGATAVEEHAAALGTIDDEQTNASSDRLT